ncbi:MAG: hypothetical protein ACNA7G_10405 [Methylobacter sp.]
MKYNINLCILPECYLDTNLVESIVPPEKIGGTCGYNHQRSCNKVVDEMMGKLKDAFALGIVDQDKRPLSRTSEFELVSEKHRLKLYKHKEKNHYLIFHPLLEKWIVDEATQIGFTLDNEILEKLKNDTKTKFSKSDQEFKRLFRDLQKRNAPGIRLLADWTSYLKKHPYDADKLELINL